MIRDASQRNGTIKIVWCAEYCVRRGTTSREKNWQASGQACMYRRLSRLQIAQVIAGMKRHIGTDSTRSADGYAPDARPGSHGRRGASRAVLCAPRSCVALLTRRGHLPHSIALCRAAHSDAAPEWSVFSIRIGGVRLVRAAVGDTPKCALKSRLKDPTDRYPTEIATCLMSSSLSRMSDAARRIRHARICARDEDPVVLLNR